MVKHRQLVSDGILRRVGVSGCLHALPAGHQAVKIGNFTLKGNQTYLSIAALVAYEWAVAKGHLPLIVELRLGLVGAVLAYLRAGSKRDAAKVVSAVKTESADIQQGQEAPIP